MTGQTSAGGRAAGRRRRTLRRFVDWVVHGVRKAATLLIGAVRRFLAHRGTQFAAAISYYTLLSIVPMAILLAAVFGLIVGEEEARTTVVDFLFEELPSGTEAGRKELNDLIGSVTDNAGTLGLIGAVSLLITASALMGSVRHGVNVAFDTGSRRPFPRAKILDVAMVFGVGLLVFLSFAFTVVRDFAIDLGEGLGVPGEVLQATVNASGELLPAVLTAAGVAVLYRVLPIHHVPWRDLWPAVLFAVIVLEVAKLGFTLYLENFANYNAVYGALAGIVATLVFVFVSAIVLLIGAEMAALWPRVRRRRRGP